MSGKKPKEITEADLPLHEIKRKSDNAKHWTDIVLSLIKYGSRALIVYIIYLGVKELAGKVTLANLKLLVDLGNEKWELFVCMFIAVSGFLYGRNERRFRKSETERFTTRIKELELRLDPNRESSGLDPKGENQPDD